MFYLSARSKRCNYNAVNYKVAYETQERVKGA